MSRQRIHSEHFYKFFLCPHWIWYDIYEDQKKHKHIPPVLEMLYRGKLQEPHSLLPEGEFVEIKSELYKDLDEAFLATLELMKQGKNIYRPVLMDGHWVGEPDFIQRRPIAELRAYDSTIKETKLGDFYYVAYDIRNDPELRDEYKFPVVFASLILEKIQGVRPQDAYIINADGESRSFLIEPFLDRFSLTLKQIEEILEGQKPAPFLKRGCKLSPWYSICEEETRGCEDVSLIHGISLGDQRGLYEIGIKTVSQMAQADLGRLQEDLPTWNFDKLVRFQNQAQVLLSSQPLILQKYHFPKIEKEIYFDVESDPPRNTDFLLGFLIVDKGGKKQKEEYQYFLAKKKEDEEKMWQDFLKMLAKLENFVIYHYSFYERHVLNRLAKKYGAEEELMQKFKDNSLDLYQITINSVVLPLYFYGLKDVAGYIGYKWSVEDAGGAEAVIWYDQWLEKGKKEFLENLVKYNEDDVRATLAVKEWLEKQKPKLEKEELPEA